MTPRSGTPIIGSLALGAVIFGLWVSGAMAGGVGSAGGAGSVGSFGSFGGSSTYGATAGGLSRGSSVIRSGTGFSVYSQRGVTRHHGPPPVSTRLYHGDRSSSRVVGDGRGGGYVYGPQVTHRLFPESPAVSGSDR
jgi:hypothetical protein